MQGHPVFLRFVRQGAPEAQKWSSAWDASSKAQRIMANFKQKLMRSAAELIEDAQQLNELGRFREAEALLRQGLRRADLNAASRLQLRVQLATTQFYAGRPEAATTDK